MKSYEKNKSYIITYYKDIITKGLKDKKSKLSLKILLSIIHKLSSKYIHKESNVENYWHPIPIYKNIDNNTDFIGDDNLNVETKKLEPGWFLTTFGLNNNNYKKYLDFLTDLNLIEINNKYSTTMKYAKQAKLVDFKIEKVEDLDIIEFETAPEYQTFLNEQRTKNLERVISFGLKKDESALQLAKLYEDKRLTIDFFGSMKFVNRWNSEGIMINGKLNKISSEKAAIYKHMIVDFANGEYYIARGERNNRLYHTLAGLKRELRQFVRIDGRKTIEIDLKNSQPYILSLLAMENYPLMDDVKKFNELCTDGNIYEFFVNEMGLEGETGRDIVKKMFLTYMFAPLTVEDGKPDVTKSKHYISIDKVFKEKFRNVWNFIKLAKQEDHTKLAIMLTTLESKIFTGDKNAKTIKRGAFPIFDSMVVKKDKDNLQKAVKEVMENTKIQEKQLKIK